MSKTDSDNAELHNAELASDARAFKTARAGELRAIERELRNIGQLLVGLGAQLDTGRLASAVARLNYAANRVARVRLEGEWRPHSGECECVDCDCSCHNDGEAFGHDEASCHCKRCDCACHADGDL